MKSQLSGEIYEWKEEAEDEMTGMNIIWGTISVSGTQN